MTQFFPQSTSMPTGHSNDPEQAMQPPPVAPVEPPPLIGPAELVKVPFGFLERVKTVMDAVDRYLTLNDMARCQLNFYDPETTQSPLRQQNRAALESCKAHLSEIVVARYQREEEFKMNVPEDAYPALHPNPLGSFMGHTYAAPAPGVLEAIESDETGDA